MGKNYSKDCRNLSNNSVCVELTEALIMAKQMNEKLARLCLSA